MASIDLGANTSNTSGGGGVTSINAFAGAVTLTGSGNVQVISSGSSTIEIVGSGGGIGTVTQVNTGSGLFGGPITTTGTISVASVSLTNQVVNNLPLSQTSGSLSLTTQVSGILPAANTQPLSSLTGSVSLTAQVSGNLSLSQTSGSISLTNQVSGNLPLSQTSGSISLINQVVNNLPLSQTSGSISLTAQVSGVLPAAQVGVIDVTSGTSGSVSLTNKVSGVLPNANMSAVALGTAAQVTGSISLTNQVVNNLPLSQTSGSISLTAQVSGVLPVANSQGLNALVGSASLTAQVSGVLPIVSGGTNASAALSGKRFIVSSAAGHVEHISVTASSPLRTDANGLPTVGSTSLSNEVTGSLPFSSVTGSVSLVNQVVGSLSIGQGGSQWISTGSASQIYYSGGNVGIGTTTPLAALSVGAGSLSDSNAPVQISTGGVGTQAWYQANKNGNYGLLIGYANGVSIAAGSQTGACIRQVAGDPLHFFVNNTVLAQTISSAGWVGIGTTVPAAPLHVITTGQNALILDRNSGSIKKSQIGFNSQGTNHFALGIDLSSVNDNNLFIYDNDASATRFFVNSSGSIGIGTTNPTAQLHTTGTVRFANFGVGTATFDANGNISSVSDEDLKDVQGSFSSGTKQIKLIEPIVYKWKSITGYDTINNYTGWSAQNVQAAMPSAVYSKPVFVDATGKILDVSIDDNGNPIETNQDPKDPTKTTTQPIPFSPDFQAKTLLSVNEREIIAALVVAVQELDARLTKLGG